METASLGAITLGEETNRHQTYWRFLQNGIDLFQRNQLCYPRIRETVCWLFCNPSTLPHDDAGRKRAQEFADALTWLGVHARGEDRAQMGAEWSEFQAKADAWRALPAKPPLSDGVRMHLLVAEDAFKQKDFDKAIEEYEAGLTINPLWPEGQYNVALLYGEEQDYEDAARHMRAYLELEPDAPDAKAVRDQMLLWQGKTSQQ
jgi:tetratricopeptide (TPR) repeat protein